MNSQSSTKYEINTVSPTNICVRNDYIDFFFLKTLKNLLLKSMTIMS